MKQKAILKKVFETCCILKCNYGNEDKRQGREMAGTDRRLGTGGGAEAACLTGRSQRIEENVVFLVQFQTGDENYDLENSIATRPWAAPAAR